MATPEVRFSPAPTTCWKCHNCKEMIDADYPQWFTEYDSKNERPYCSTCAFLISMRRIPCEDVDGK